MGKRGDVWAALLVAVLVIGSADDACAGLMVGLWATVATPGVVVACTDDSCAGLGVGFWATVSAAELVAGFVSRA